MYMKNLIAMIQFPDGLTLYKDVRKGCEKGFREYMHDMFGEDVKIVFDDGVFDYEECD